MRKLIVAFGLLSFAALPAAAQNMDSSYIGGYGVLEKGSMGLAITTPYATLERQSMQVGVMTAYAVLENIASSRPRRPIIIE